MNSSGIYFSAPYLALCQAALAFLCFMNGSGWPMRLARLEAPQGCLTFLCAGYGMCITSSTNTCWWECQFCKHSETVLKRLLATIRICLELISYLEGNFSKPFSYRNLVKPLDRIKGNPLCPESKTSSLGKYPFSWEFMGEDRYAGIRLSPGSPICCWGQLTVEGPLSHLVSERAGAGSSAANDTWQTPGTEAVNPEYVCLNYVTT